MLQFKDLETHAQDFDSFRSNSVVHKVSVEQSLRRTYKMLYSHEVLYNTVHYSTGSDITLLK